jgi:hypothetical protein
VALAVAAGSGGTNAATVFWVAVAPAALVLYEIVVLRARRTDALAFAWRAALLTALASSWWLVPVWIQSRQGPDFLAFTEQPHSIWSTSSMSESLRLMGYWLSYFRTGFGNFQAASTAVRPYLTSAPVIVATFAVPLMAFGGLLLSRRWRYAPFFGLLAVGALLVMAAGYPPGKPAASTLESVYYHLQATQFLRTTYKVGPLLALSLACLAGIAAKEFLAIAAGRLGDHRLRLRWLAPAAFAAVAVLFALPLFTNRLIEPTFAYGTIPRAWRSALADAARTSPGDRRIMVLPGQLFGAYRWGETVDPTIAPVLTRHPVLQRTVDHYADPRAAQLQEAVDDLVQQGRLVPGQLRPLLELMGVGQVLVAADGRPEQTGESSPATIAESLRDQRGFERVTSVYGAFRRYAPLDAQGGPSVELPDLRRYATPGQRGPRAVRLAATEGSTVLDGDGAGVAELAATADLSPSAALFYAGNLDRRAIRSMVRTRATLVFSDSNRRRRVAPSLIRGDLGPTLAAGEAIPRDAAAFNLFPERGTGGQTVADYADLAVLRSPMRASDPQSPARRPYAAFDGRVDTTWSPPPGCACLELALRHPRAVPYIRVHPRALATGAPVALGVTVNGGAPRVISLSPLGWHRIAIGGRTLRTLRLRVLANKSLLGAFGLDEVEIPGVRVRESLRLPTWLAQATRGLDLTQNPIAVELQRTTNDFPFRPSSATDKVDPESGLARQVTLPTGRRFEISGWATPSPDAGDDALDRLAGLPAGWRIVGSSRFEGIPARRASAAFDGDPNTAWVADYEPQRGAWLSIGAPGPFSVRRLRLARGPAEYAFPAQLDVEAGGQTFRDLRPRADGSVILPRAVRTRSLRIDVTDVAVPSARRPLDAVALGELDIPGLRPPRLRHRGHVETRCGELVMRSSLSSATARVLGSIEALDRGAPLRLAGCGHHGSLALPAGTDMVTATGATMRPYILSLRSPAGRSAPPPPPGVVQSPGHGSDTSRRGVRLRLKRPGWLVLGEGYNRGWRAACRSAGGTERQLGAPRLIDGFANGWLVGSSCAAARFWFVPQRLATVSYVISALAGLAVLVLLLLPLARRPRTRRAAPDASAAVSWPAADSVLRLGWAAALALGVGVGLLGAWLFAVRAGVLLAIAVGVLTWLGVTSRRLLLWLAIPPLAVIPLLYVLVPSSAAGSFFGYADEHLAAHWLAVAAVCAIAAACLLDAWRLRQASAGGESRS